MTDSISVLDKADILRGEVRRLELGQQGEQQAQRVRQRVQAVRTALGQLDSQLRVARAVVKETAHDIDLSSVSHGHNELARRAEGGALPSDSAFNAAKQKIEKAAASIREAAYEVWRAWAAERIGALPTHRLPMLKQADLAQARARLNELRKIASSNSLAAPDVGIFVNILRQLSDELHHAPDVPIELVSVLDRLTRQTLTLKDLLDEEIQLLRRFSIDHEIEVRRKTS
ncbi:hypothetical protein [Sphaerimonospora thailandensis]|uniref:Uncharacterized protein n=1 Tax=Sphaerimonospora thailandensis TaxID=795644 RepID=A0A8J3W1B8_9ACTN|nr:hypothetical protein [Sphaerimonospora thailandensis]GIH72020.1 hypothetical protein Mth01_42730 [Sphaerimonospora thailandensis]